MSTRERIILVEDDQDLRESLIEYLTLSGYAACGVSSGLDLYRELAASTCSYSLAVLDLGLPDQDGFVLAEYLRKNTSMGIIILSARDAIEDRIHGYGAGADLYLVKPVDCRELAAAIDSLTRRRQDRPANPPAAGPPETWRLDRGGWTLATPDDAVITLTGKEMELMALLSTCPGRPVPRETIQAELYGRDDEHTGRALESLVRRLRVKISATTGASAPIKTSHGIGYCFASPLSKK